MKICLMCGKRNMNAYGICPECSALNEKMRNMFCDLTGKTAFVTGGRIHIGYAVCLRLLRQGANVIALTRYPKTALEQYQKETDYAEFRDRLEIIGFDLMRVDRIPELITKIEQLCNHQLDILVNNAAQTVKKSNAYYAQLNFHEENLLLESHQLISLHQPETMPEVFSSMQAVDYGETEQNNSWVRKPEDISPQELLEVQLINVTAPFLLTNGLKQALSYHAQGNKFVINVSSAEGKFHSTAKLARHVHTNMAKAALNMMTNSLASDFAKEKIYMYSCDPGWVSNQFPPGYAISRNFKPYLSFEDGAARVLYPVTLHLQEEHIRDSGAFYKDYRKISY